ncbi:MAG TPA: condensation domain-containing protein, partial [Kofleriaceae bacterium]
MLDKLYADVTRLSPQKQKLLRTLMAQQGLSPSQLPIVAVERGAADYPLSFPQQRIWLLHRLAGSSLYNTPWILRLRGPLDRARLAAALARIVQRHEALRSCFPFVDGSPRQRILPPAPVELPAVDLRAVSGAAEREARLHRELVAEIQRPLDLERGPIVRARLFALGTDEHVLVATT